MSVPVAYIDIGRSAKDLLKKDYPIGSTSLKFKTTAPNGVTFTATGHRDNKTGIIATDFEVKYADHQKGVSVTDVWSTSNSFNGKLMTENYIAAKGIKVEILTSMSSSVNGRGARISATYKKPNIHSVATHTLDAFKSNLNVNTVLGCQGFLVGGEVAYNAMEAKISRYSAAIGYSAGNYAITVHATSNLSKYTATYYHRFTHTLAASGKAVWSNKMNAVALEVGAKLHLDRTAFVKGKINNTGTVGVSYTQAIRPGVMISLGVSADTARFNENAHKIGLALTFEN